MIKTYVEKRNERERRIRYTYTKDKFVDIRFLRIMDVKEDGNKEYVKSYRRYGKTVKGSKPRTKGIKR